MIKISLKQHLEPFRKFGTESIRQTLNGFIYGYYRFVPEERPFLNDIQTTIIPAPKFEDYYKDYYEIKSDTSNCWSLQKLNEVAKPYDYIEDIMTTSKKFFSKEVSSFHSFLIERLYNLNDFQNKQISYFNTKKQIYGDLIYENNKIYKQEIFGEQFPIPPNKAIHFEVRQIKKRLGIAL